METIRTHTVIIGGGPSGATAARELAQAGIDTLLIEKDIAFEKPCGGGLFLRAFDEFSLPLSLVTRRVETIDIVSPDGEKVSVDIQHDPLGIVHRKVFDATLRDLAQQSGATILHAKAQTITTQTNGIVVEARNREGKLFRIHADYLIAADGVHSTTRKQLRDETPSRILTYYADVNGLESASCQFWFGDDISPGHYAWIFPHHQGINIGLIAEETYNPNRLFRQWLQRASLVKDIPPKHKGYFIPYWKPMTLHDDRILYVGDSASLVLPFTYEGIYYALQSGRLAAQALIANDPKSYPKNWNALNLKRFKFLRLLQNIFLKNDWFARKMCSLYRHPKFQKAVMEYWSVARKPAGFFATILKIFKAILLYRASK